MHRAETDRESKQQFIDKLYTENSRQVYAIVQNRLHPTATVNADDCVQEIFMQAVRQADRLMEHPNPKAWLLLTARYVILNTNRKSDRQKKQANLLIDKLDKCSECDVESLVIEQLLLEQISNDRIYEKIMQQLSESETQLLQLKWKKRQREKEIARQLHVPLKKVRNQTFRLRQKIMRLIHQYKDYF